MAASPVQRGQVGNDSISAGSPAALHSSPFISWYRHLPAGASWPEAVAAPYDAVSFRLSGFGGFDHDHGVHGILIGPDMKLYYSVGDQGVKNLQSSDGQGPKWTSNNTDCQAGTIWRCDLDGKNLELIAHNFRNEYEPCVDSFGTVFVSDNDDDGNQQTRICYVMPGGNYGYHVQPRKVSHWNEEIPGAIPSGNVDEERNRPEGGLEALNRARHRVVVGNIDVVEFCPPAARLERRVNLLGRLLPLVYVMTRARHGQ